jgi:predicted RecB family nuclease
VLSPRFENSQPPGRVATAAAESYRDLCWKQAEAARDIALLPGVDQSWARKLHEHGVADIPALRAALDRPDLRPLFYEPATKKKPEWIKPAALTIRRSLEAHDTKAPVPIAPIDLPAPSNCVMLDLEGLPPRLDELEKVYLWGIRDFRTDPPRYLHADASFGPEGDRRAWEDFLRIASSLLDATPNLRFVHYGTYEKTKIELYLKRYGDVPVLSSLSPVNGGEGQAEGVPRPLPGEGSEGIASHVLSRLFDLHRAVTRSVALPVSSYGLKEVEKLAGFTRKLSDAGGAWAMCRYIEATETSDPAARDALIGRILAYNEEDLDATWSVMEWLGRLENHPNRNDVLAR